MLAAYAVAVRVAVLLVALVFSPGAHGEPATARYAPAQLAVAQDFLQRAREAAAAGDGSLVGKLAWQASLDARLAWGMSESWAVRAPAARIFDEARRLVRQAVAAQRIP
jgi:chromosome condensin MukBEF complex kleisin-like MukF subunit